MAETIALPHWTVAAPLPSTGNPQLDRELNLRLQALQENFEGIVSQTAKQLEGAFQQRVPAGVVFSTAASSPPPGYLACDGAAVSRSTYSELFGVIGTTYGSGDGSTTFNVPNYNDGRVLRGNSSPGGTGGSNTHTHNVAVTGIAFGGSIVNFQDGAGASISAASPGHDHDVSAIGTADSRSNVPAYRDMFCVVKT